MLVAALFLALLIEQSPHLVHHVFEQDAPRSECVFAIGAERAPIAAAAAGMLLVPDQVERVGLPSRISVRPAGAQAPADSRAPPQVVS
jgi:hypothetical protein